MRIVFVLPVIPVTPIGGVRVIFEYANHLARRGHEIEVVAPRPWPPTSRDVSHRSYWRSLPRGLRFNGRPDWLPVEAGVRCSVVARLRSALLPGADATVATGWQTARTVAEAGPQTGAKFQIVQHYETWSGPTEAVNESIRLPLHKIVISRWLADLVGELSPGARVSYIPNGMNFETFSLTRNPEERDGSTVAMLLHQASWKGTQDGLEALSLAHERRPEIRAELFSTMQPPSGLPKWMEFRGRLDGDGLRALYNRCGIFLHPSLREGWPLPPAEAMACGCAVVAADNPGVLDYAVPGVTALVAPRASPEALAEHLVTLVDDPSLRVRLAYAGRQAIAAYTWERAVTELERVIVSGALARR